MSIYQDMREVATDVMGEFEQPKLVYQIVTKGTGPKHNPGPPSTEDKTLEGAVARPVESKFVDGTTIVKTDTQVTFPIQQNIKPSMSDNAIVGGQVFKIIGIHSIPPTMPIVHKIICRQ